jgi:G patch domain-containing protein 1
MGTSSDDDDDETYITYGTPLQQEEESRAWQRRKDVKDAALTKQLPLHQQVSLMLQPRFVLLIAEGLAHFSNPHVGPMQEVTDAEGRRRFHGAFTGGYSAGYYNTVGSLEGWNPSTFKTSRDERTKHRCASWPSAWHCECRTQLQTMGNTGSTLFLSLSDLSG